MLLLIKDRKWIVLICIVKIGYLYILCFLCCIVLFFIILLLRFCVLLFFCIKNFCRFVIKKFFENFVYKWCFLISFLIFYN